MHQLKYIFLIGCVSSMVLIELTNAHFRLGRGMEQAYQMPLKQRRVTQHEFQKQQDETKRDMFLRRLERVLHEYESKMKRGESDLQR